MWLAKRTTSKIETKSLTLQTNAIAISFFK